MTDQASTLRKLMKNEEEKAEKKSTENEEKTDEKKSRIIAVASGKGGVGKTNLTVNLGLALQELGEKVLLLDADIGMANINILLGLTSPYTLKHVIEGNCDVEDAVIEGPGGLDILSGISGEENFMGISKNQIWRLLDASAHLEKNYDIIIIDIGAGAHKDVLNFTMAADEALIVLTPEPTAIMDAYSLIKILSKHQFNSDLGLVINMVDDGKEGQDVIDRMKKVIDDYLGITVKTTANIPYDKKVVKAVKKQTPIFDLSPNTSAVKAYRKTAANLVDRKKEISTQSAKSFFSRIVGLFKKGEGGGFN